MDEEEARSIDVVATVVEKEPGVRERVAKLAAPSSDPTQSSGSTSSEESGPTGDPECDPETGEELPPEITG